MRELLLEIWTSVRRNKLRTFLTGFSVAWGIFMLVILLGSGNGLQNGVLANFNDYATNSIDLYGGRTSVPWMGYEKGRRIRMRNSDLEILERSRPTNGSTARKPPTDTSSPRSGCGDRSRRCSRWRASSSRPDATSTTPT